MFGFGNAAPFIEGRTIKDSREDYRVALKLGDVRCGQKAVYFHHDGDCRRAKDIIDKANGKKGQ